MSRTLPLPATQVAPAREPVPIAFGGSAQLAHLRGNDFIVRRTSDWCPLTHVPLGNPAAIGALADGSLVALDAADGTGRASLLVRVAPGSRRPALHDGVVPEVGALRICPLAGADELACARPGSDRLYRLRLVDGRMELAAAARLRGERSRIMTALGDGSIVYASGARELVRAAFGALPRRYAVPVEPRALLAGPGRDLLWLRGEREVLLVSLAEPMRPLVGRALAEEVVDLAASGRNLALLVGDRRGAVLVCHDERALERWRRPLGFAARAVACSPHHVAAAGAGALAVFDARTGALVHAS